MKQVRKTAMVVSKGHEQWNLHSLFRHDTHLESSSSRTEKLERLLFDSSCIVALMLDVNYKW
jgi:hypothetical protein